MGGRRRAAQQCAVVLRAAIRFQLSAAHEEPRIGKPSCAPAGRYVLHVLVFFVFVFEIISGFFLRENYDLKRCVRWLSDEGHPSLAARHCSLRLGGRTDGPLRMRRIACAVPHS